MNCAGGCIPSKNGFVLVVCEKPEVARRVSDALAESKIEAEVRHGVQIFRLERAGREYVVCSALGHLYAISDLFKNRDVYPVFELGWFPANLINKGLVQAKNRIEVIRDLASGASDFINACDFDVEGETIGDNILRYSCQVEDGRALRAKFSTLTREELISSFQDARVGLGKGLSKAGRARHMIDFIWGVNLSRALIESVLLAKRRYRVISVGRVQGPTLAFVVEREAEIKTHVPVPYWSVSAVLRKDGQLLEAAYSVDKMSRTASELIKRDCEGKKATASDISRTVFNDPPPVSFNIGDLQKEAYRLFGYSPSRTLQIAERLYLDALISYPRTSSQKIPPSIGYRKILDKLGEVGAYRAFVDDLLKRALNPRQGGMVDSAHPAIYPTGNRPGGRMQTWESKLYDLIARRFLSAFGEDAVRERVSVKIEAAGHSFRIIGRRTLSRGWMDCYGFVGVLDKDIPHIREGDSFDVVKVNCAEKFESGPARYNQSSLLEKMEGEGIGTKATRADIITTLMKRGYVSGQSLQATELGFSVVEAMRKYSPQVISSELTHEIERRLGEIELGEGDPGGLIADTIEILYGQVSSFKAHENEIGGAIDDSISATFSSLYTLGACPLCKTGTLRIIRSSTTHKRFVGCSNYSNGCRASAPLPQRGSIKSTRRPCKYCGWPIVYVRLGRAPWRLCVNVSCPNKGVRKRELSIVPKRS